MKFEWDQDKLLNNKLKHGVAFEYAARIFMDNDAVIFEDSRKEYKELRYNIVGEIEGRVFVVIYTMRGSVYRIISARKGNKREQKKYHKFRS